MRRLLATLAMIAAALGALPLADAAAAREHGDRRGGERTGAPPWAHGWPRGDERRGDRGDARGEGRWARERPPEAYGPPPGYVQPRRGGYLPPQARGGVVEDYGRYRLRQPPRGYAWVRSGHAMMLMDMNTGQVFDVIPD